MRRRRQWFRSETFSALHRKRCEVPFCAHVEETLRKHNRLFLSRPETYPLRDKMEGPPKCECGNRAMIPLCHGVKAGIRESKNSIITTSFAQTFLADTLAMQRVHFSNPSNFNDPWDCYSCFDSSLADNADYRARCIRILRKFPLLHLSNSERTLYERELRRSKLRSR
jgi:hypothetical protein